MAVASPFFRWISMKPPPPRLPAPGHVTASAKAVATAASTALPPFFKTSVPTFEAIGSTDTTAAVMYDDGRPSDFAGYVDNEDASSNTKNVRAHRTRLISYLPRKIPLLFKEGQRGAPGWLLN